MLTKLNAVLDEGACKAIFDHLRNFLMCASLLAIGSYEFTVHSGLFLGLLSSNSSGDGVIALAGVLMSLNLYDGVRRLSILKYHSLLSMLLVILYILASIRIVELAWSFRTQFQAG